MLPVVAGEKVDGIFFIFLLLFHDMSFNITQQLIKQLNILQYNRLDANSFFSVNLRKQAN